MAAAVERYPLGAMPVQECMARQVDAQTQLVELRKAAERFIRSTTHSFLALQQQEVGACAAYKPPHKLLTWQTHERMRERLERP